ncbi:MAG: c-type cytochrome [Accumulibacter sp.]|uniref:c-type cytochrome n=1 Tax=Accumulibacter sp. TaxID=2053492 RepID=UPI002FC2E585
MARWRLPTAPMLAMALALAGPSAGAADPDRGAALYEARCGACHSLDAHRVGPLHKGVFGRRAGSAPGYQYSLALESAAFVWDAQTLDAWLQNPEALVPGQRMGYSVSDATDRADLVAFLRRASSR